jgi:hypothetical protein
MIFLLLVGLDTGATGNQYCGSYSPVILRVGWIMLSSVIAEEGLGIFYLFKLYWRQTRKHVDIALKLNSDSVGSEMVAR